MINIKKNINRKLVLEGDAQGAKKENIGEVTGIRLLGEDLKDHQGQETGIIIAGEGVE